MKLSNKQINQYIKEIKKKNWYRQGGGMNIYFVNLPYRTALYRYDGASYCQGDNNYGYFNKDKEKKIGVRLLNAQRIDRNFVSRLIKKWQKVKILQNNFLKRLDRADFIKIDNKKFVSLHTKFVNLRLKIWLIGISIEIFDPWGDYFLKQELKKYPRINLSPKDLVILTKPAKRSFLQIQRLELLKLALEIHRSKVNIKKIREDSKFFPKLLSHQKRWHYIHNTWSHIELLSLKFIFEEIRKCLGDIKQAKKEYNYLINYEKKIRSAIAKITKESKSPKKLTNILYFFRQLATWRDERKEWVQIVNKYADKFLKELSRRTGVSYDVLKFIDPVELKRLPLSKEYINELKQRQKVCICIKYGRKYYWVEGNLAQKIKSTFDATLVSGDLKGVPANTGKVKGIVKVAIIKKDFKKIKRGDVLVTQMTRPEFLPILHKVSAIVTDEGGITCHAAIVSRELGIPCVIATQVATNVLKDGDKVEVDANKGIIRKL